MSIDAIRANRCDWCWHIEQRGESFRYWGRCTLPYGHEGDHMPEDWITEAAKEISHETGLVPPGKMEVDEVIEILHRHSPFKDGVAYMPVPRCNGCRHWNKDNSYVDSTGECGLQNSPEGKVSSDCGDYTIYTTGDFGCVQFETKS